MTQLNGIEKIMFETMNGFAKNYKWAKTDKDRLDTDREARIFLNAIEKNQEKRKSYLNAYEVYKKIK